MTEFQGRAAAELYRPAAPEKNEEERMNDELTELRAENKRLRAENERLENENAKVRLKIYQINQIVKEQQSLRCKEDKS